MTELVAGGRLARLEPLGVSFSVDEHETLMHAAQRHGYSWPTVCGGNAGCATCYVRVLEGMDSLSPPAKIERDALRRFRGIDVENQPEFRLACQVLLSGPVSFRKVGVRSRTAAETVTQA